MKEYQYKVLGRDQYQVVRIDKNLPIGHKDRYKEYLVDLRNGDSLCDCPGFQAKINTLRRGKKIKGIVACKHVKDILAQLRDSGGILDFSNME